jgi:hypothetical protein
MVEMDTLVLAEVSTNEVAVDLSKADLEARAVEEALARTAAVVELIEDGGLVKPRARDRTLTSSHHPKTSTSPSPTIRRCTILSCSRTKATITRLRPLYSTSSLHSRVSTFFLSAKVQHLFWHEITAASITHRFADFESATVLDTFERMSLCTAWAFCIFTKTESK